MIDYDVLWGSKIATSELLGQRDFLHDSSRVQLYVPVNRRD